MKRFVSTEPLKKNRSRLGDLGETAVDVSLLVCLRPSYTYRPRSVRPEVDELGAGVAVPHKAVVA